MTKALRQQLTTSFNQMGVEISLLSDMDKAPPTSIYWMSAANLEKINLVTSHSPKPGLKAEQLAR